MNRAYMYLEGRELHDIGSLRDSLTQAIWVRQRQIRVFETFVNVMANGLSINPDVSKNIEKLTSDYLELIIPGSKEAKRYNDEEFAARTNKTLSDVAKLLAGSSNGTISDKIILKK